MSDGSVTLRGMQSGDFQRKVSRRLRLAVSAAVVVGAVVAAPTNWVDASAPPAAPLVPARLLETRPGQQSVDGQLAGIGRRGAGTTVEVTVTNRGGVPADADAVMLNVAAIGPSANGHLTIYPCGTKTPTASSLNYTAGQVIANEVLAKVGTNGRVCIYTHAATHLIADVSGYLPDSGVIGSVRFDLAGAAGVALAEPGAQSSRADRRTPAADAEPISNLKKVAADGTTSSAIAFGNADVDQVVTAQDGNLYLVFQDRVEGCLLAQVDPASGSATCVDDELQGIVRPSAIDGAANEAVQTDADGRVYYLGRLDSGRTVLRRYDDGDTVDLINDNIFLNNYVVTPSGHVIVAGETISSGQRWLRRISPAGGLKNLIAGYDGSFMTLFPDGNVYVGHFPNGVSRYLSGSDSMDSRKWIGSTLNGDINPHFDSDDLCYPSYDDDDGFCVGWMGGLASAGMTTLGDRVFVVAGSSSGGTRLMQYYPTLERASTSVDSVGTAYPVVDSIALTGTNETGQNITTIYNSVNDTETPLIGPDREFEIYHFGFSGSSNRLLFDGLRFADNKYVTGYVDLGSKTLVTSQVLSGQLLDFRSF